MAKLALLERIMEPASYYESAENRLNKVFYSLKRVLSAALCGILTLVYPLRADTYQCAGDAENYFRLREMFISWDTGFTGSKTHHRKRLNRFLTDLVYCNIRTDYDFLIDPRWVTEGGDFSSDIIYNKWLYIHGEMDPEFKKGDMPDYEQLLRERVINRTLFAVSGKIRRFSIVESFRGRFVHLWLDRLRLEPARKKESVKEK